MSIVKLSLALLSLTSSLIFSGSRLINPTPVSGTQTEFAENLQPPQEEQMIETIQKLCDTLSAQKLTVDEVANSLGTEWVDAPLTSSENRTVRPFDPAFKYAIVFVNPYNYEQPMIVSLYPEESLPLSVKAMRSVFGDYIETEPSFSIIPPSKKPREPRVILRPPIIVFNVPSDSGGRKKCSILVRVKEGESGVEDGTVIDLGVRREVIDE
ncbi:MAG TPA: hypothetical protein DEG17_04705 [Cyanobacteria bacterium UBA11149]|nr:hypothetical protein [Cyanobacteria bacterium UBA11367]HBE58056.1 hypothetical protein [Cyanobacteria bacterium UBA11366]HBK66139.1 hypothetical protein [Cyanobacteria bacterium UBA11166]HBR74951.1 hypothetical protein [Cyanobacteria bacterium UBA11159]HBS71513.1 hypothetical protein [Cyanobacteria bacterium UBA11153]HBW88189.1 hypothetical protein [Cyanobacteria bacterium UBA11149]HCA94830.1 hypothetical protein [Cyanobacteria bacterium UBA9226]